MRLRDRAALLSKKNGVNYAVVIFTVFICAIVLLATFPACNNSNIRREISAKCFRGFWTGKSSVKHLGEVSTKFSKVRIGIWQNISVGQPTPSEYFFILRNAACRSDVSSRFLYKRIWNDFHTPTLLRPWAYLKARVVRLISNKPFFVRFGRQMVQIECRNNFGCCSIASIFPRWEKLPDRNDGIVRPRHSGALMLNWIGNNERTLNRLQGGEINLVGFKHSARLNSSEDSINCSNGQYPESGPRSYGIVVLRISQPFEHPFKFHWAWFPFGIVGLLSLMYGFLMFLYGLGKEGSSITALKGLGLSVIGWIGAVFCLFHWLYPE